MDDLSILREFDELATTANPTVYWKLRRRVILDCPHCRPHRGYDSKWSRHGRTDRYKDSRKGRLRGVRSIRDPRFWEAA